MICMICNNCGAIMEGVLCKYCGTQYFFEEETMPDFNNIEIGGIPQKIKKTFRRVKINYMNEYDYDKSGFLP